MSVKRKHHYKNNNNYIKIASLQKRPNVKRSKCNQCIGRFNFVGILRNSADYIDNNLCDEENHFAKGQATNKIISKKTKTFLEGNGTAFKVKTRKEPLPMKLRAFPRSFWQQPNRTSSVSPAAIYCASPPLPKEECRPANRETAGEPRRERRRQEIVSKPDVDLLFSLFRNVEEQQQKALGSRNATAIRRGRPKKIKTESKAIRDDDPYLSSSATGSLLPLLPRKNAADSLQCKIDRDEQILARMSIGGGSSGTIISPVNDSNSTNFSQILSELVVQL